MSPRTHSQDLVSDSEEEKSLEAYREAAKSVPFCLVTMMDTLLLLKINKFQMME